MTAINAFVAGQMVHIWTDGALLDGHGLMRGFAQKVLIWAHLPAVIALRGSDTVMSLFERDLSTIFASFDDLVARCPAEMHSSFMSAGPKADFGPWGAEFDVVVAGYSAQRSRPELYLLTNDPKMGVPAWQMVQTPGFTMPHGPGLMDVLARASLGSDLQRCAMQSPLRLLRAQRAFMDITRGRPMRAVGGFAQHTVVGETGAMSKIVERWPDRIGEPITADVAI